MINTDNVLISNQDVHVICTIPTVYVGQSVLIEFPIPVTLLSMVLAKLCGCYNIHPQLQDQAAKTDILSVVSISVFSIVYSWGGCG